MRADTYAWILIPTGRGSTAADVTRAIRVDDERAGRQPAVDDRDGSAAHVRHSRRHEGPSHKRTGVARALAPASMSK
jgi:hypothetical protein